mmetsp:Transcript_5410/g.17477  ORF Transcript_5410/g.17477 Transcript_5410/m.17477 type:complete len:180 (-) Transcript_5410:124-663(-)
MTDPFFADGRRPSSEYLRNLTDIAQELMDDFPHSSFNESTDLTTNTTAWAQRGHDLAVLVAYEQDPARVCGYGSATPPTVTAGHLEAIRHTARRQLALGGYNLAAALAQSVPSSYKEVNDPPATSDPSWASDHPVLLGLLTFSLGVVVSAACTSLVVKRRGDRTGYVPLGGDAGEGEYM